jgi:hypothetical protein
MMTKSVLFAGVLFIAACAANVPALATCHKNCLHMKRNTHLQKDHLKQDGDPPKAHRLIRYAVEALEMNPCAGRTNPRNPTRDGPSFDPAR